MPPEPERPGAPDLSAPRRTSALGALLAVFGLEQLRPLVPVVVVAASSGRFLLVLGLALVVGALYNAASWWRRTWWFDGQVLHLDEGVVVRSQRRIPVERIQHVEIERKIRHQALDLAVVRIETAGGSGAELRLDSIPLREAEALRRVLGARATVVADPAGADGAAAASPEVLVRLPPGRLLLAGITGPEVAAVLAALAVGFDLLADLGVEPDEFGRVDATVLTIAVVVIVGVPLWLLVAGVIGVVRRWDLTATVSGEDLRVTYGLFRKAEFVGTLSRVQDVRIAHRLLLRPFGRADLRVRTAASGAGQQSRVDIPLLDATEIDRVLRRVLPAALPMPALVPAPAGARRRALVRSGGLGAAIGVVAAALASPAGPAAIAVVPLVAGAGLVRGEAYYRGLGAAPIPGPAAARAEVLHARSGAFTRLHAIVPAVRVQSAAVESTLFQRRRSLATVRLDLAGASVEVVDRGDPEATAIVADAVSTVAERPSPGTATAPTS